MPTLKKVFLITLLSIFLLFAKEVSVSFAQTSDLTNFGISVSVNDTNVQNGDIICSDSKGYNLCKNEYDSSIVGIVNNNAAGSISLSNLQNPQIIVSEGQMNIRVSSTNGNIKTGSFITTSKTPGVGQLSTRTGFVIGTALEDYTSNDKTAVGQIKVALNIHANTNLSSGGTVNPTENLIDLLRNGLSGLGANPIAALRYVLASIMVLISFALGLIYFGRIAKSGVEAIGRNPLAGIRIQTSVIINIVIMIGVIFAGLVIAYLILAI